MPGLLTVTSPAATTQLTTMALAKSDLGIGDTSQDTVVSALIDRASSVLATHCGRAFGLQGLSETFRFNRASIATMVGWPYPERPQTINRPPLVLSLPADTFTSVTEDGTVLTRDTDYEVDQPAGLVWRLRGGIRSWWTATVVVVAYSSGWNLPNDGSRNLPADLEDHCMSLVRSAYYGRGSDPNVSMDLTEGVGRVQYWNRSSSYMGIDADMANLLSRYVVRVW